MFDNEWILCRSGQICAFFLSAVADRATVGYIWTVVSVGGMFGFELFPVVGGGQIGGVDAALEGIAFGEILTVSLVEARFDGIEINGIVEDPASGDRPLD